MKGFLISFEGTDGCGKSTQIRMLAEKLIKEGREVVVSHKAAPRRRHCGR